MLATSQLIEFPALTQSCFADPLPVPPRVSVSLYFGGGSELAGVNTALVGQLAPLQVAHFVALFLKINILVRSNKKFKISI